MTPEQLEEFNEMKEFIKSLKASSSIPFDVDAAFRDRFGSVSVSTKGAASENQAVDESGSSSYNVLGVPTGFLKVTILGTDYNFPYF